MFGDVGQGIKKKGCFLVLTVVVDFQICSWQY